MSRGGPGRDVMEGGPGSAPTEAPRPGLLGRGWVFWALVTLATAIGAWLRLRNLSAPSLWVDEFFTISRAGSEDLHWINAFGYLPSRFTLWMHGADLAHIDLGNIETWARRGVTEGAARLGPCLVGIATVPLLAWLARPLVGSGVAGVSALLVALTPWHLYWSQMARFYTTQFLLANVFLLLFARAVHTGRPAWFAGAVAAGLLGFVSHFTTLITAGLCFGVLALLWAGRRWIPGGAPPPRRLLTGMAVLVGLALVCFALLVVREIDTRVPGSLSDFSTQSWDPDLVTLVLGTVLRIEPVTFAVGAVALLGVLRRREPTGLLVAAVAVGLPVVVFALTVAFPVGPRYFFVALYPWTLLAGLWCVELDRRLAPSQGAIAGLSGVLVLAVAVGFSAFLYSRDGAGERPRWRDAFRVVREQGRPDDPLYVSTGRFQARFYLERDAEHLSTLPDPPAPGTWVVERTRGARRPVHGPERGFAWHGRFEIPSKPWSWVLNVAQVPPRETR